MLIFFSGKIKDGTLIRGFKRALKATYRDFLFPAGVVFICVLATYMVSKMLEPKNVFGGGGEKYIVIIIDDFGYNGEGTDEMLALGIPITAAIMPAMASSEADAAKFHEAGYDVILHQPMEPHKGKGAWLGPFGLTSALTEQEVNKNINSALETVAHAVGINNHMGSKIMENERIIAEIIKIIEEKDLIFIDSKTTDKSVAAKLAKKHGIKFYERDVFLDNVKSVENTKKQLFKAAEIADKKGYAIAIGHVGSAGGKTTAQGIKEALPELRDNGYKFITISDLDFRMSMELGVD